MAYAASLSSGLRGGGQSFSSTAAISACAVGENRGAAGARTAVEAAQIYRRLDRLGLAVPARQRAKIIPDAVQLACGLGVAPLQCAEGVEDQFGQRATVGRTDAVEPGHHRAEERQIGRAEQAQPSTEAIGEPIDGAGRKVALLDTDRLGNIAQPFEQVRAKA